MWRKETEGEVWAGKILVSGFSARGRGYYFLIAILHQHSRPGNEANRHLRFNQVDT